MPFNTSFDNIFGILNSDILETSINLIFFFWVNISIASLENLFAITISTKKLFIFSAIHFVTSLFNAIIPPKIEIESHA